MAAHVHEAIRQVQEIRRRILRKQLFAGYSGKARIFGGIVALVAGVIMSRAWYPAIPAAHIAGWGAVCLLAFAANFAALVRWHRGQSGGFHSLEELRPVLDVYAPLLVGGMLTFALLRIAQYDLLFGTWMTLFGLANVASRHSLPEPNFYLGWFYITAGAVSLLFAPSGFFLNPWPMSIVFFGGEVLGGYIFLKTRSEIEE